LLAVVLPIAGCCCRLLAAVADVRAVFFRCWLLFFGCLLLLEFFSLEPRTFNSSDSPFAGFSRPPYIILS
jgi:hypothetical protein